MLQVHRQIDLRDPVLLCAFTGWADAASGASGALSYVLLKRPGDELASFDPEAIYNYTVTRPVVRMGRSGPRELKWPALTFTGVALPDAEHDLLVLLGPEPDLRWRADTREAAAPAGQLRVRRVVGLGSVYGPLAQRGPVP